MIPGAGIGGPGGGNPFPPPNPGAGIGGKPIITPPVNPGIPNPVNPGIPGNGGVLGAADRVAVGLNLKQLFISFQSQAAISNDTFPSVYSPQGKKFSWRVAILPQLEGGQAVLNQLKLNEAWDSPHNLMVAKTAMPKVFAPVGRSAGQGETFIKTFTGMDTIFSGISGNFYLYDSKTAPIKSTIRKGLVNTVLFVDSATPVIWTKPEEIEYNPKMDLATVLNFAGGKASIVLADGSVKTITPDKAKEELHKAINQNAQGNPNLD